MRWCWGCWKIRCSSFDSKLEFHGTLEINVLKDNAKIMFLKLFFCGNREKTVEDVVRRCQRGHHALIDNKCLNVSLPADEYFLYLINNRWLETANCFRFSCFFFSRSSSPWGLIIHAPDPTFVRKLVPHATLERLVWKRLSNFPMFAWTELEKTLIGFIGKSHKFSINVKCKPRRKIIAQESLTQIAQI